MLYDPKWEVKTKTDPLTLQALISWLEQQPKDQNYDYGCNGHCMLAQYFQHCGIANSVGGQSFQPNGGGPRVSLPVSFRHIAIDSPRTFGGALTRARDFAESP